jgi:hypothetical protein
MKHEEILLDFNMDQALAATKTITRMVWNYYKGLTEAGFSKEEAFQLTMEYQKRFLPHDNN